MKQPILFSILLLLSTTVFSQDTGKDPYAIFGHKSSTKYETTLNEMLYIKNKDTSSKIKAVAFDMVNQYAILLGEKEVVLYKVKIQPEQLYRWMSVDPLAEKYQGFSPYNFVLNNPLIYIDPDGREVKNGMQDDLNNAQNRLNTAQSAYDNTVANNGTKKEIRQAKRELNNAKDNFGNAQDLFNRAQSAIDLVKQVDPDYFNKINTLKDKGGSDVNVYVTATNNFGDMGNGTTKKGETSLIFQTLNGQPYTKTGTDGQPYVQFFTTPQAKELGFTVTLFGSASQSTIANEFGNVEFSTENSVLDATQQIQQVPYAQKAGEIYSFKVQAQFEAKLKLLKAKKN